MSKIALYQNTQSNSFGYRRIPISFETSWKVGDLISEEVGKDKLVILSIKDDKEFDINEFKNKYPQALYKDRTSIYEMMQAIHNHEVDWKVFKYLYDLNISLEDVNLVNTMFCFSTLLIFDELDQLICDIPTKVVKRNEYSVLNYEYLSRYIEEDVDHVEIAFSVIESDFCYTTEEGNIILSKGNKEYTLEIIHEITLHAFLKRISRLKHFFASD